MDKVVKTFKTQIYLNADAVAYCNRAFGVRRVIWNKLLSYYLEQKQATGQYPKRFSVDPLFRKELAAGKDDCYCWIAKQQTTPMIMVQCLKQLELSFVQCHKIAKKVHHPVRPNFKKKRDLEQTFTYQLVHNNFVAKGEHTVRITTGGRGNHCWLRTRESVAWMNRADIKLCTMTISKKAGKYWLCITYEKPNHEQQPASGKIGMDLGINKSIVWYDGQQSQAVQFNTAHSMHLDRLAQAAGAKLSSMKEGSNRYNKQLLLQQKRAMTAANIRKDSVENFTSFVTRNYAEAVIDTFNFKGALKVANHSKAYRAMTYVVVQRLKDKAAATGTLIREVEHKKGIKTTMKCSNCGSERVNVDAKRICFCNKCKQSLDRDLNAAINCYKLK